MVQTLPIDLPAVLHEQDGEIRLVGHRISIVDILTFYREGYTPEMLAARYETITLAQIHHVIAFYLENQTVVDRYLDQYLEDCDRIRKQALATPEHQRLRQRLLAMREAQRRALHVS